MPKAKAKTKKAPMPKMATAQPTPPPPAPVQPPAASSAQIAAIHLSHAEEMKANLERQKKVMFMIPLMPGENDGSVLPVTINGYRMELPKNRMIEIPEQVALMLAEKFKIETTVGKNWLINRPHTASTAQPVAPMDALS